MSLRNEYGFDARFCAQYIADYLGVMAQTAKVASLGAYAVMRADQASFSATDGGNIQKQTHM
jgi:carbonic anhydrase/acetyltransferase-like protein (isoleucine patch superfamily)